MSPSQQSQWRSKQDFSRHNETDFMSEFASGGRFSAQEITTAIQEFVKDEDNNLSALDQTNSGLAMQSENALKIMLGLSLCYKNEARFNSIAN